MSEVLRHSEVANYREAQPLERTGPISEIRVNRLDAFLARRRRGVAWALGLCLVALYQLDDSIIEEGDAVANVELATNLLRTGTLEFTPRNAPIVFKWHSTEMLDGREDYYVRSWREQHLGKPAGYWYATGALKFNGPRYFIVKSPVRDAYVCTFGIVAGLTLVPIAAVLSAIDPNFIRVELLKLTAAKLHAGMLIALSAVLLFLIAQRFCRPSHALLTALAYALGTCVWAISSETLWQQTVNIALLTGVAYTFVRILESQSRALPIICGFLLGTAFASRPTALFMLVAVVGYLWLYKREAVQPLLLAAIPVPALIAIYNGYYFGSAFNFGQGVAGEQIAFAKTGAAALWSTPAIVGLFGLLASPSRGLLVFSPFMALSFWGAYRIWKQPEYRVLRPLTLAAAATMLLQAKWFDWWGGWAYGYRPWLEAVPVLALCLVPVLPSVLHRRWSAGLFGVALAWSIFVQGLGALAYDKYWNGRDLFRVDVGENATFFDREADAREYAQKNDGQFAGEFRCNIDIAVCRFRLWQWKDSIIPFYMGERFEIARRIRTRLGWSSLGDPMALQGKPQNL